MARSRRAASRSRDYTSQGAYHCASWLCRTRRAAPVGQRHQLAAMEPHRARAPAALDPFKDLLTVSWQRPATHKAQSQQDRLVSTERLCK